MQLKLPHTRLMVRAKLIVLEYPATCRSCGQHIEKEDEAWYDGKDNDGARIWCRQCLPNGELEPYD